MGGIDLARGRRDDSEHRGDDDPVRIDPRYGLRPPWHDLQLELHGPAVLDVDLTFRERWEDRTPPTAAIRSGPCGGGSATSPDASGCCCAGYSTPVGSHAVQVLRTYPARHRAIPFAPDGSAASPAPT